MAIFFICPLIFLRFFCVNSFRRIIIFLHLDKGMADRYLLEFSQDRLEDSQDSFEDSQDMVAVASDMVVFAAGVSNAAAATDRVASEWFALAADVVIVAADRVVVVTVVALKKAMEDVAVANKIDYHFTFLFKIREISSFISFFFK